MTLCARPPCAAPVSRWQVAQLPDSATHYVLDGAHTADSAAALAATLRSAFPDEPVVLVVAMAADKQHRCGCGCRVLACEHWLCLSVCLATTAPSSA